nr:protein NRT1/ PTR FAMILY 5.2-like [Tanacetum cinerariifolium]
MGTVTSSNNVTNWVGTIWMTPILGAYFADAVLGRYWTFIIAAAIYLTGMCLLVLAVSVPALKPPSCDSGTDCKKASTLQLGVFFGALYTLAVGTGGTKPNISTIGADQFDDFDPKEKNQKLSFFNWWMFSIFFGTLFANTVLVYIQDNVGCRNVWDCQGGQGGGGYNRLGGVILWCFVAAEVGVRCCRFGGKQAGRDVQYSVF